MNSFSAEANLAIGVQFRTQIIDGGGEPTGSVVTGGALRAQAWNLGIISFQAQMHTTALGGFVTDKQNSSTWTVTLFLPGSPSTKTEGQEDTELIVSQPKRPVAFRTVCQVEYLMSTPL